VEGSRLLDEFNQTLDESDSVRLLIAKESLLFGPFKQAELMSRRNQLTEFGSQLQSKLEAQSKA
jgi:hypothetical protein